MSPALKQVVMIATAGQWLVGTSYAYWVYRRPERGPKQLRFLVQPPAPPGWRSMGRLYLQGLGWMLVAAVSAGLLIPILPVYAAFQWHYSCARGSEAGGFWPKRRGLQE